MAVGVLNDFDPSWVSEGDDDAEAVPVEIWVEGFPVRLICAYGPQENDKKERKDSFWRYLNLETQKAATDGTGLIIQMDGNLWAGKEIIHSDPRNQNQNGKFFETFLLQNPQLTVVNALPICKGSITHVCHTIERIEESILDFFIVCDVILSLVSNMKIDTQGEITLTRFKGNVVKTVHRMLKLEVDLIFHKEKVHDRIDLFNIRNKKCQKVFQEFTSKGNMLSNCFVSDDVNVNTQFQRWQRRFNKAINACLKKCRTNPIDQEKISRMDELMLKRKTILKKNTLDHEDAEEVDMIEREITDQKHTRYTRKCQYCLHVPRTRIFTCKICNYEKEIKFPEIHIK